jgi:tRNA(Ile)-lysidine synthase TilS/MesJ
LEKPDVFQKWETHNRDYLIACKEKRLIVTFSGGKDSSACLFLLHKVKDLYNYDLEAHLYAYPRHIYEESFKEELLSFWGKQGVRLFFHPSEEDDSLLEHQENPCVICQNLRKKALLRLWSAKKEEVNNLIIVSGNNLCDLASYLLEISIATEMTDDLYRKDYFWEKRLSEISYRFHPFLSMKEGYAVFRPMLCLNQNEIENIIKSNDILTLSVSCRYSHLRPKKILAKYFKEFDYQFSYKKIIECAQKKIAILDTSKIELLSQKDYFSNYF